MNQDKSIFSDGTNPLLLIDELCELGKTRMYATIDSSIGKKFDPKKCYTSWKLILTSEEDENPIKDVFIFVEDTSKISITKVFDGDLLSIPEFTSLLPPNDIKGSSIALQSINKIVSELPPAVLEALENEEVIGGEEVEDKLQKSHQHDETIASIRVSSDKLDELMNQVSELVTTQAGLTMYSENNFDPALNAIADNFEKLSRQLRDIAFGNDVNSDQQFVQKI